MKEKYPGWGNITDDMEVEAPKAERPREGLRKLGGRLVGLADKLPKLPKLKGRKRKAMPMNWDAVPEPMRGVMVEDAGDLTKVGEQDAEEVDEATEVMEKYGDVETSRMHEPQTAEERDLVREMEWYRAYRKGVTQGERAQEWAEKLYNENLTSLGDLEMLVAEGREGISERTIEYGDKEIKVYDLTGVPFKTLQHTVDYKLFEHGGDWTIGRNVAKKVVEDPSLWLRNEVKIQQGGVVANQESNTLSLSYVDAEVNSRRGGVKSDRGIIYGFSAVRPDSIIAISSGDAATSNTAGKMKPEARLVSLRPEELAKYSTNQYNEVLLRRYDEQGEPMKPDFLVVHDGRITEDTKRHAAYFGVPIVNIEDEPYAEKQKAAVVAGIENINAESSYDEVFKVLQEAEHSSLGLNGLWKEDIYAEYDDADKVYHDRFIQLPDYARRKLQDVVEMIEPAKRLEMLSEELTKMVEAEKQAQAEGKWHTGSPVFLHRMTHQKRGAVAGYSPENYVDALEMVYKYGMGDGKYHQITTVLNSTDPGYQYFSELVDEYADYGGMVVDDRVKRRDECEL